MRRFGPRPANAPDDICKACNIAFKEGDYTTLVALGPGADDQAQEAARDGRFYNAVCVQVHWTCATGQKK